MKRFPNLFSSIKIKCLTFKNRICMAPQSTPDDASGGFVSPRGRVLLRDKVKEAVHEAYFAGMDI